MSGYSPVRTNPLTNTTQQEHNPVEPSAGVANNNWNLRDRLNERMSYNDAVRKGFVGTEQEWREFLTDCKDHEPAPTQDTKPQEPAVQPAVPIPDLIVRLASHEASRLTVVHRSGILVRLTLCLLTALLLMIIAVGAAFMNVYTRNVTHERLERPVPCSINKDGLEITGTRNYSYMNHTFGPYHWHSDDTVVEKTIINASMNGLVVVAITDGVSKTLRRGQAEGGILILPKADYYTFFSNGKATGASYAELCK